MREAVIERYDVLIVGTGHGGAQTAIALRQAKFTGTIGLLGDEADAPYERPPLSKDYLAGKKAFDRFQLRPPGFWQDHGIDLLPNRHIVRVDAADHHVTDADGDRVGYGSLVWATGGTPRRLSCDGHDLAGVHGIRTRADVDALRGELAQTRRVCVIGGGFIGLEAAAAFVALGKAVVLLETMPRVLARVASETLSRFYEDEHRTRGVDVRLATRVTCLTGSAGRVTGVELADGQVIACDMVVVGIGIDPAVAALRDAGAAGGNGVDVDPYCRTSLPDIYAVGDCAAHVNAFADGARVRLESVQNATDQATAAVRAIVGAAQPYHAVPWFWSNQYDLRLQTIGLSIGYDGTVVRGDPAARAFSIVYLRRGQVIALDCVNATRDYVQGRRLVAQGLTVDPALLADTAVALKDMATEAPE